MIERTSVIITGLLGAGKSELVNGLVTHYGFESRGVGDELARLYRTQNGLAPEAPVTGLARMAVHKSIRKDDPEYFSRFLSEGAYRRRVFDGLRNFNDATGIVKAGGQVISLVAPRAIRFERRLGIDTVKDPSIEAMMERELQEMDDKDPDGAQALRVMALSHEHGFFVDATQDRQTVLDEVVTKLGL